MTFSFGESRLNCNSNVRRRICEYGFERRKSEGVDGTSCYRIPFEDDTIELHGACVGRYSKLGDGFLYIRNRKRCFLYLGDEPPVPGLYIADYLRSDELDRLYAESLRFLEWWLAYEAWVASVTAPGYRDHCFRKFRKLPTSKSWLPPELALEWLHRYASGSLDNLERARAWKNDSSLAA